MRYNPGTGHPDSFKAYLIHNGMTKSTFPRYVGNRLHIVFHLAGLMFQHINVLLDYLENYCR